MADIKLEVRGVSFVYGAGTPYEKKALDSISLVFEKGSVTGLIGHTGSGKSTLVRLLNGLEKPSAGQILLDGQDIWEKPKAIRSVRFRVGLVMQYPEYQLFEETVEKDIAYGPSNMGLDADEIHRRVTECAEIVGLEKADLEKSPFDLSGGMKRRAAIAGIMAMEPEVIVLDEPAAGLDPAGRRTIFDAISHYRREKNATVIIVSHSMEDMAERCDSIAVLNSGKLCLKGTGAEIFSDPHRLTEAGLDMPEISRFAMLLRDKGTDIGSVYTVKYAADALERLFRERGIKP